MAGRLSGVSQVLVPALGFRLGPEQLMGRNAVRPSGDIETRSKGSYGVIGVPGAPEGLWGARGRSGVLLAGVLRLAHDVALRFATLSEEAERGRKPVVVVLDNAPFHTAGAVRDARAGWEAKGLRLYYLPPYCPHLNPIEGVWRSLKGFLMPRRFYDSLAALKQAVLSALNFLRAVEIQC